MGLNDTPRGNRVHIGFFGRRNAGKSSLVNAVTGQDLAVVSEVKGTTTDPVYKAMELLPLGPVLIIDTPGIDDEGALGEMRVRRARQVLNKTDVAVLVVDAAESGGLCAAERELLDLFRAKAVPHIIAWNKSDLITNNNNKEGGSLPPRSEPFGFSAPPLSGGTPPATPPGGAPETSGDIMETTAWLLQAEDAAVLADNEIQTNLKDIVKTVSRYYRDHWNSEVRRDGWVVKLTNAGIRSSFQRGHGKAKINAFAAVPHIIQKGKITGFQKNRNGRTYDSWNIAAPITIGGTGYIGEVLVHCHRDGTNTFYLHEVEEKAKLHSVFTASYDTSTPEGASKLRIAKLLRTVKGGQLGSFASGKTPSPPFPAGEITVSAKTGFNINLLKERIAALAVTEDPKLRLVADLLHPSDFVVLVVPIDKAAPKGRLILPQQQTIRDILEADAAAIVVKEFELRETLERLGKKPALVITDSQVFAKVSADVPPDIPLTSFSILFARYKGALAASVRGVTALDRLKTGDRVLIAEGCTHHRQCDDIGTVKLPRWIKNYAACEPDFSFCSGGDFPDDLSPYKMVIHCGGCMLNEREIQYRRLSAEDQNIPFTNYGITIAFIQGILRRSVAMFPNVLAGLED